MQFDSTKPLRILIVEDDTANMALSRTLLGRSSLSISELESAESLNTALELLDKKHFDVVMLDLNLPDSKGLDTLAKINEQDHHAAIIVVTGEYGEDFGLRAIANGAQEYLTKGMFNKLTLVKSVHYAVERKRAEEALRESEEKYRKQFEEALDAIFITHAETGIIVDCNPAALELVGREKTELVGEHQRILHPPEEIKKEFRRSFKQILDEKEDQAIERQVITKNGEVKDVSVKASLFELTGEKVVQGVFRDITGRKRLSEILERKQQNLEAIFDAAPVGMLLVDENMIVRRVNSAISQMLHRDYSEIINRRIGDVLGCTNTPRDKKGCGYAPSCATCPLRKTIKTVLDSGQSVHEVEVHLSLKIDNEEVAPWLSVSAEPAIIDGFKRAVVAIDDVTDRKKAEEKLRETMEIKSQFISTVSHELRTPLTCVKEAIAAVLDGLAGKINGKQRNLLDIAKRNIDRLIKLISDVLDFQKLEAGKIKPDIRENSIRQVVEDVHSTMVPLAKKKELGFSIELDDNLPKARFDSGKITQVLTNLVSNAIKFTPERGQVRVCAQHQGQELVIRVSDTGIGIPKEAFLKIFDRFYRVHQRGKQIQGTGLGLAIVKKIVMMHRGRIEVESEVNQGATFTVFLPLNIESLTEVLSPQSDEMLEKSLADN
ncbi:Sensor histidine kinase RcsC [subsurface metagenome]